VFDRERELEAILDGLVNSYAEPLAINNLETAALPNRRLVIQAFESLQRVLFLGFFSTRPLDGSNLRDALSEFLGPCYGAMVEQIRRAVSFEERRLPIEQRRPDDWAEAQVLRLLAKAPELRRRLEGDVQAAFTGDPAAESLEEVVFSYPGIRAITAHRVAHALFEIGVPMIPRILAEHAHSHTGIDIHPGARIGRRFFIDHGTGVVIGATAVLGDDVKLYQGVTLGALSVREREPPGADGRPRQRHPTLEDGVTVYAGATILGGDTVVGAGSVIGGNVWLTRSVPPGSKIYRHSATQGDPSGRED
jgi:serine O-acetyltransferase